MELAELILSKDLKVIKGSLLNSKIAVSKKFKEQVGSINWDLITQHYIFYFEGEAADLFQLKSKDKITISKVITSKFIGFCHDFVDRLWFVKDNSCFCNQVFLEFLADQSACINYKDIVTGTSLDEFSFTDFTAEEMKLHLENFSTIKHYEMQMNNKLPDIEDLMRDSTGIINSPMNYVVYDLPRLSRALIFLGMVRKNGSAITKITFFMTLFECLFTSDDQVIAKKIRERASSLLGGDSKARRAFREVIVQAYNIRSRNLHGDIIDTPVDKIRKIVVDLDNYTRQILNTILNMEKNEIFTSLESQDSKQLFEAFFDKLVGLTVKIETMLEPENQLNLCSVKLPLRPHRY